MEIRQRLIFPARLQTSIFSAEGLNFCVRNGNRWDPFAIATGNCISFFSHPDYCISINNSSHFKSFPNLITHFSATTWSSPRPISIGQLHALLHFHPRPIYLIVFEGSYFFRMGSLILKEASRLDAFSVYPVRTSLLGHGPGDPTDTPEVRPSRSSRTRDSSSQTSCAHSG